MPEISKTKKKLTGKYKFKETFWTGSMVLWVQEQITFYLNEFDKELKRKTKVWRKITKEEISIIIKAIKKQKVYL